MKRASMSHEEKEYVKQLRSEMRASMSPDKKDEERQRRKIALNNLKRKRELETSNLGDDVALIETAGKRKATYRAKRSDEQIRSDREKDKENRRRRRQEEKDHVLLTEGDIS